jgi:hypothetical protein
VISPATIDDLRFSTRQMIAEASRRSSAARVGAHI